jgi:hypothetical protein
MSKMSGEKEKLDQLVEKIDELLSVLRDVSEDLKMVSASMKSLAISQITAKPQLSASPNASVPVSRASMQSASPRAPASSIPAAPVATRTENIEDIRILFPENLESMLAFEDKGDYVMIKPKQFLGSENFAKIASTVRGIGGEYISAGRDSHFRVYKKKS